MVGNVHLRTDYFRHRNAEKYSCLPLPIFLNNTRNALAGVKLAGAFLVEVIKKTFDFFKMIYSGLQFILKRIPRRISAQKKIYDDCG